MKRVQPDEEGNVNTIEYAMQNIVDLIHFRLIQTHCLHVVMHCTTTCFDLALTGMQGLIPNECYEFEFDYCASLYCNMGETHLQEFSHCWQIVQSDSVGPAFASPEALHTFFLRV